MHVLDAPSTRSNTKQVALVGIVDQSNRLLMARCKARPTVWQPIGGHVEPWDTDHGDTIIRETREETGLVLDKSDLWSIVTHPSDTGEGEIHFYLATARRTEDLQHQEEEIDELRWVTVQEAKQLPALPATRAFLQMLT